MGTLPNATSRSLIEEAVGARVLSLGLELHNEVPNGHPHAPFTYSLMKQHGDLTYSGGVSAANDVISMGIHVGTHIDALGHISQGGHCHGGVSIDEIRGTP